MKRLLIAIPVLFLFLGCCNRMVNPQEENIDATQEDELYDATIRSISASLPATDGLGRKLPMHDDVGDVREGKFVGLFYWIWHTSHAKRCPAFNVGEFVKLHPDAIEDFNNPAWEGKRLPTYWWGEPLFGFYRDTDPWVLRKHAEMLCEAGVDVIIFDCTNGTLLWEDSCYTLCEMFQNFRADGVKTPQIAFMLPFAANDDSRTSLINLYDNIYSKGRFSDLWFYWKGKPLIMAHPDNISNEPAGSKLNAIYNFFTFRPNQPVYKGGESYRNWGWLEIYPQQGYWPVDGGFEEVTVGVSQNWSAERGLTAMNAPNTFGRSYTAANGQATDPDAVNYGLNFQEQWERALQIDPEFIFITGWNEWNMGRYELWQGQTNAFPDEFNQEKSRDIEPMRGGHGDNYYWQMVSNIRRFKGMPAEDPSVPAVAAPGNSWKSAGLVCSGFWSKARHYSAYRGNAIVRNHEGWGSDVLVNNFVNNDIIGARAAHDNDNLYFHVSESSPVKPSDLKLFIDADRKHDTGWEGYDWCIAFVAEDRPAILMKARGNSWSWEDMGELDFSKVGSTLAVKVPKSVLGIKTGKFEIEFKWTDSTPRSGNASDLWLFGDVAPLGRFNYLYKGI